MNARAFQWQPQDNPTVEPQRPGYCVVDPATDQFVTSHQRSGRITVVTMGPAEKAVVYQVEAEAREVAGKGMRITTRPRWNGFTREWLVLP